MQFGWSPLPIMYTDTKLELPPESVANLTKRKLFAAMAMQGLLASDQGPRLHSTAIAKLAVDAADALIAELAKERK